MTIDHKKLAVIHIVKRELGFDDRQYRDFLKEHAGVNSAKELDDYSFRRLMRAFARSRHYQPQPDGLTLRQKLYIEHLVAELSWDVDHFRNFLKKYYHHDRLSDCSKTEASHLIESLKNVGKHHG